MFLLKTGCIVRRHQNKDGKTYFYKLRFLLVVFNSGSIGPGWKWPIFGSGSIVRMRRNKDGKISFYKLRFLLAVFFFILDRLILVENDQIFGSGSIVRMRRNKDGKICSFKLRFMDAVFDSVSIGAGWKWTIFRSGCIVRMQMWSWVHKICSNKSRFLNAVYDSGSIDTNKKKSPVFSTGCISADAPVSQLKPAVLGQTGHFHSS